MMYTLSMPKKILIIDDDYNIAKENKEKLLKAGYEIVVAYSAKEGLEKLKAEKPDCVLLDLVLPDESGFLKAALRKP